MISKCSDKRPELLAPAGNLEAGLMAFECGADAVYAGLQRFNARERNDNFTPDDMVVLISSARRLGRRVYLTLNTLVRESELRDVAAMLKDFDNPNLPDAVIVQDLGVLAMLRECFPELAIHASTQMAAHNSAAVNWLASRGVNRVILERQIPLAELSDIVRNSRIGVEVFVHGALCCSLSGNCLLSSWLGGWSGNRGKCKQPCRRRYSSASGSGLFFSTNDLYALDLLDALEDAGVAALKIEGRLRNADYVRHVVNAYRMMLDTPRTERRLRLNAARAELSRALGRKWSHGLLVQGEWKKALDPDSPGVSGMLCGRVLRVKPDAVVVRVGRRLHFGDRIRIQSPLGDVGPSLTVTMMRVDGCEVKTARRGDTAEIRCNCALDIASDGLVYHIGVAPGTGDTRFVPPSPAKEPLRMMEARIFVTSSHICVHVAGIGEWTKAIVLPTAHNRPLTPAMVDCEFRKSPPPGLTIDVTSADVTGSLLINQRDLRRLRQEFMAWLGAVCCCKDNIDAADIGNDDRCAAVIDNFFARRIEPSFSGQATTTVLVGGNDENKFAGSVTAVGIMHASDTKQEVVLPDFCPETELSGLRRRVNAMITRGFHRWRVTSLYGMELLGGHENLKITVSFPLPIANSAALIEMLAAGVEKTTAWPELDRGALEALAARAAGRLEIYCFGRPALLTTRIPLPTTGRISDARGNVFEIIADGGLWRVFAEDAMELDRLPENVSRFIDLTHARMNERKTRNFNFDREFA